MNSVSRVASRFCKPIHALGLLVLLSIPTIVDATEPLPEWWSVGSPPPLNLSGNQPLGVANRGQAKYMAKCALDALRLVNPGLADSVTANLVGIGKPIPNWNTPVAGSPEAAALYAPLLLGQLKAIALPFYNGLNGMAAARVLDQIQVNHDGTATINADYWRISGNPNYTENGYFPWNPATLVATNQTPATIGQLKAVFALRFEKFSSFDTDLNGIPDTWELANAGKFAVYPPALNESLGQNRSVTVPLFLDNQTASTVNYTVSVTGNSYDTYSFSDSLTGGLAYVWEEISATGTFLATVSNADDADEPVNFTNFNFPFYGQIYNSVYVSSNGLLTFGTGSLEDINSVLPSSSVPRTLIAALWDDLKTVTSNGGGIYWKQESDHFIIQYKNVGRHAGPGTYTFQIVLFADGKIQLRYQTIAGFSGSCTVGCQKGYQSQSLPIIYNGSYLMSQMAIEITPSIEFLTVNTITGSIPANSTATLNSVIHSSGLPFGQYTGSIEMSHNGTGANPLQVAATLHVVPNTIELIQPANNSILQEGGSIDVRASAFDSDGLARVQFFDDAAKIGEFGAGSDYTINGYHPAVGDHQLTARRINVSGSVVNSYPVSIKVISLDTDGDGVADSLDAFTFDPSRAIAPSGTIGDITAPLIFLTAPSNAVPTP